MSATRTPGRKRLIQVSLPLAEISKQSTREKSIRHGHISTLHIWWARRPLASLRDRYGRRHGLLRRLRQAGLIEG